MSTALNNGERWITSGNRVSNFTLQETECRCGCGYNEVKQSLIDALQAIRDMLGVPVKVNCVCRCKAHNEKVKGASNSFHMQGLAADIAVSDFGAHTDMTSESLFNVIKYLPINCIIKYPEQRFVHIDMRQATEPIRWVKNSQGVFIPVT